MEKDTNGDTSKEEKERRDELINIMTPTCCNNMDEKKKEKSWIEDTLKTVEERGLRNIISRRLGIEIEDRGVLKKTLRLKQKLLTLSIDPQTHSLMKRPPDPERGDTWHKGDQLRIKGQTVASEGMAVLLCRYQVFIIYLVSFCFLIVLSVMSCLKLWLIVWDSYNSISPPLSSIFFYRTSSSPFFFLFFPFLSVLKTTCYYIAHESSST